MILELLLFGLFVGVVSGYVTSYILKRDIFASEEDIDDQVQEVMDRLKQHVVPCRLEFVNQTILMYNRETNEFIAQGNTFEELELKLKESFPDKFFDVCQEDIDYAKTLGKQNG